MAKLTKKQFTGKVNTYYNCKNSLFNAEQEIITSLMDVLPDGTSFTFMMDKSYHMPIISFFGCNAGLHEAINKSLVRAKIKLEINSKFYAYDRVAYTSDDLEWEYRATIYTVEKTSNKI